MPFEKLNPPFFHQKTAQQLERLHGIRAVTPLLRRSLDHLQESDRTHQLVLCGVSGGAKCNAIANAIYYHLNSRFPQYGRVPLHSEQGVTEIQSTSMVDSELMKNIPNLILVGPRKPNEIIKCPFTHIEYLPEILEAATVAHEATHDRDHELVGEWIEANTWLKSHGGETDPNFVDTVVRWNESSQEYDLDLGFYYALLESRGYAVSSEAMKLLYASLPKRSANDRRRLGPLPPTPEPEYLEKANRHFGLRALTNRSAQRITAHIMKHGVPSFAGPLSPSNLFEFGEAIGQGMDETIRRYRDSKQSTP